MPRTAEDVENYLHKLNRPFENDGGTFVLRAGPGRTAVAVLVVPPVVAVNVAIGPIPANEKLQLQMFRRLLELNAKDLMHASYGLDGETIVLGAALALDNLDINELDLTLSDIDLALASHVPSLHEAAQS